MGNIKIKNIQFIKLAAYSTLFLFGFMAFLPGQAEAILNLNPNPAGTVPTAELNYLRNADSYGQTPAFTRWISLAGQPTVTTVNVPYGTTTVNLQFHEAAAIGWPQSATNPIVEAHYRIIGANSTPAGIITGAVGSQRGIDFRPGQNTAGTFRRSSVNFTYSPAGGFTTSGVHTIRIQARLANRWLNNNVACVAPGSPAVTMDNWATRCNATTVAIPVRVNVIPPTDSGSCSATIVGGTNKSPNEPFSIDFTVRNNNNTTNGLNWAVYGGLAERYRLQRQAGSAGWAPAAINISGSGVNPAFGGVLQPGRATTFRVSGLTAPSTMGASSGRYHIYGHHPALGYHNVGAICQASINVNRPPTYFNVNPDEPVINEDDGTVSFSANNSTGDGPSQLNDGQGVEINRRVWVNGVLQTGMSTSSRIIIAAGGTWNSGPLDLPALDAGDTICAHLYIRPVTGQSFVAPFTPTAATYQPGGTQYRERGSTPTSGACVTIPFKPYLKFFGGEVVTGAARAELDESSVPATIDCQETGGGHISAWARNNGSGRYQGASSQLTVSGLLSINQFYSASNKTSGLMAPKSLTFANEGSPEADSEYGGDSQNQPCIPDYFEQSKDPAIYNSGISWNGSSGLPADDGRLQLDLIGNTIAATTVPRGTQVAIFADGDVTITGNITYQTGATAWEDHPYFVLIVNGDINIDRNVTRLDGLYIAQTDSRDGTIRTCTEGSSLVTKGSIYASCLNQLSINGGLIADRVKYLRTFGSLEEATDPDEWPNFDSGSGTGAAEVINYTPEMFLAPSPLARPARPGSETNTANRGVYDAIKSMPPAY